MTIDDQIRTGRRQPRRVGRSVVVCTDPLPLSVLNQSYAACRMDTTTRRVAAGGWTCSILLELQSFAHSGHVDCQVVSFQTSDRCRTRAFDHRAELFVIVGSRSFHLYGGYVTSSGCGRPRGTAGVFVHAQHDVNGHGCGEATCGGILVDWVNSKSHEAGPLCLLDFQFLCRLGSDTVMFLLLELRGRVRHHERL